MHSVSFKCTTVALTIALAACSKSGSDAGSSAEWEYATSTEVLGQTLETLEKRLGKPYQNNLNEVDELGDLGFEIGGCKVGYTTVRGKVAVVRIPTGQACHPGLQGVKQLAGARFDKDTVFAAMPAALLGTWRGDCLGVECGGRSSSIYFFSRSEADGLPDIELESRLDTKESVQKREAWARTFGVDPIKGYSASASLKVMCGAADQAVAGNILRALRITSINFGRYPAIPGCPKSTQAVPPGNSESNAPTQAPTAANSAPAAEPGSGAYPVTVKTDKPPTPQQAAAARPALAREFADVERTEGHRLADYTVAMADLNGDRREDMVVQVRDFGYCGTMGCSAYAILATPTGFASQAIDLGVNYHEKITVMPAISHGMHDLRYDGSNVSLRWNGKEYE